MESASFSVLCEGIGLSESDVATIRGQLQDTAYTSLRAFEVTAQVSLGASRVLVPPLNESIVRRNWSEACVQTPGCIIQPETAEHVSKFVRMVDYFRIKFSVRSGGHSPNLGWSSIGSHGVLLDMQKMAQVDLSADAAVVSIGPGALWGDVMASLSSHRVSVVGGRIPNVGVAGLILGGGYSYLSGEFGTAADNVKNFEVVLGNGSIVNANSAENSDLFWALKGGGPNFGIVTRFDMFTMPVHDVWYEVAIYSTDQASEVFDAFALWQTSDQFDPKASVTLFMSLDFITVGLLYSASTQRPTVFAPFQNLTPMQVVVPGIDGTLAQVYQMASASISTARLRHDYRGISTRIDADLNKSVYSIWRQKALAVREVTGADQIFALQAVPKSMVEAGIAKGGNPMSMQCENQQWWTTLADWADEKDDALVRSVALETCAEFERQSKERGLYLPFIFMNDASVDQNPLASYGEPSLRRLKDIAKIYDPAELFQKYQNGGFLLCKS
ncbi:FAD-binding domain-containing protein [Nemania diffusa]|nr:FAD-binding domain-containing protein [Nemania diffusa]